MGTSRLEDFVQCLGLPSRLLFLGPLSSRFELSLPRSLSSLTLAVTLLVYQLLNSMNFTTFRQSLLSIYDIAVSFTWILYVVDYILYHLEVKRLYLELSATDRELRAAGCPVVYPRRRALVLEGVTFGIFLLKMVLHWIGFSGTPEVVVHLSLVLYLPFLVIHSHETPLRLLLRLLNSQFEALLSPPITTTKDTADSIVDLALLECLCKFHNRLTHIAARLSDRFSLHFLLLAFQTFLFPMLDLFFLVIGMPSLRGLNVLANKIGYTLFSCLWFIQCISIANICMNISEKAELFHGAVQDILLNDEIGNILYSPKLMNHLRKSNPIVFKAGGLFEFKYEMMTTILGSATIYFIVLIQFIPLTTT